MFYLFCVKCFLIIGSIYLFMNAMTFTIARFIKDIDERINYKAPLGLFACAICFLIIQYAWLLK